MPYNNHRAWTCRITALAVASHGVLARRQTIKLNCDSFVPRNGEDGDRRVFLDFVVSCGASHWHGVRGGTQACRRSS